MLLVIGAEDRIIAGTDTVISDPFLSSAIPQAISIGNWQTPNVETILSLKPDVIIAYESYKPKNLDQLLSADIPIVHLDCYQLKTLESDARALGNLTGKQEEAEEYISFIGERLEKVSSRLSATDRTEWPRVYFESYSDFTTSGAGSAADNLLNASGGVSIAGDSPMQSIKVNPE